MMKLIKIHTIFIIGLLLTRPALGTDLLNLAAYPEGTFVPYGYLMQVAVEQVSQLKFLKGTVADAKGKIVAPLNLTGDFMVSFKLYAPERSCCIGSIDLSLFSGESSIRLNFSIASGVSIGFSYSGSSIHSNTSDSSNAWFRAGANKVVLTVSGDQAKLYINDVFSSKTTLKFSNLVYSKLVLSGLRDKDALYELSGSGTAGVLYPIQPKLSNISTRGLVGSAPEQYMYAGFIIYGGNRKVYIRAIGQGLRSVGVNTNLDPSIQVTMPSNPSFKLTNNNWEDDTSVTEIKALPANTYGYSPPPASVDSALIRCFVPGAYVVITMPNNMTDVGIVTVDDLGDCQ
jgi:hypothetical protein